MAIAIVARVGALFQAANDANPFEGELLRDFAAGVAAEELARWEKAIATGVAAGTTTETIIREILAREVSHV